MTGSDQAKFKLYVLHSDYIRFESALMKHNISFFSDYEKYPDFMITVRYWVFEKDRLDIDEIIKEQSINTKVETASIHVYKDSRQTLKYLAWYILIGIALFLIVMLLGTLWNAL